MVIHYLVCRRFGTNADIAAMGQTRWTGGTPALVPILEQEISACRNTDPNYREQTVACS